ncbi:MAG: methyl-accepting chemotaxis protein [Clostridiales bacterium]|nr:methyl-accepting chemotaxis protein [Clostridiales bacterium]
MFKKLSSIQTKISCIIILFIVVAVIIAVLVNYNSLTEMSKESLISYTEDSLTEIVNAQSRSIDEAIEKYNATMKYLDSSENFYVFSTNNGQKYAKEVQTSLNSYMKSNPTHDSINYVCGDDLMLYCSSDLNAEVVSYADEPFIQYIMENNAAAQSDVFFDEETGEAMISIGVPQTSHFDDTTLAGVLFTNVQVSLFADTLADIRVFDSDTSYAYLLDSNGVYIYHPDETKIGTTDDSALITDIVAQISSGNPPETAVATDDTTGQYVAYHVSELNDWILCLSIDKDIVLEPIAQMRDSAIRTSIISCVVIIIVFMILGFIFASTITTPIKVVTKVIRKTADLDISHDESYHPLLTHHDETGEMSRAVQKMRQSFSQMMNDISATSTSISESADQLHDIANTVNDNANDNSATAEELSATMAETAANTATISGEIHEIEESTQEINRKASEGVVLSEEIMKRAEQLKADTLSASERTKHMYESVKDDSELAIENSKSVSKINELAKNIMDIAKQTSLLSLNASIEAARAGEQGRGFAVVADEIGKLAEQSSATVGDITQIVADVIAAVQKMERSLTAALTFLDETVLADYGNFMNVSEQYSNDAKFVNQTMSDIDTSIDNLNDTMLKMSDAISQINASIAETSNGVNNVVGNNANIVALTTDTYNMVEKTIAYSNSLREIVDNFTL